MDGEELGRVICDAYYAGCEEVGTQDNTTLSLTDLTKVGPLLTAYDTFGSEALAAAAKILDSSHSSAVWRQRVRTYGGNTIEQGYTNMVDLGHMARQSSDMAGVCQGRAGCTGGLRSVSGRRSVSDRSDRTFLLLFLQW